MNNQSIKTSRRAFLQTSTQWGLGFYSCSLAQQESNIFTDMSQPKVNQDQSAKQTGLVSDERYLLHQQSKNHPESPQRLIAIQKKIAQSGLDKMLVKLSPTTDPIPYLKLVHSQKHIENVARQAHDNKICKLAVSGALSAVDAVCSGTVANAFAAIRPPGHHAANNGEFGFCFYNNIAIAARYAQKKYNLNRVLIVDWDYHHGDGTEWAFYDDSSVLVFSTHALYAFPKSGSAARQGKGKGKGYNINVPLPRGADDNTVMKAFQTKLKPAADKFKPDLVLISAGFDARIGDPLGDFNFTDEGFANLTKYVMNIANKHAEGKLVSILEGGYNNQGLASAVNTHLSTLMQS